VWNALRDSLQHLPLVLAGPILRRTTPQGVTVWVALQAPCTVTLKVWQTTAQGATLGPVVAQGQGQTVAVGECLHLIAVTASPSAQASFHPDVVYAYDLEFVPLQSDARSPQTLQQALTATLLPSATVSYFPHQLPTFVLPPTDLHHLKLVHGSCRKLHGNGYDALALLDELVGQQATAPRDRPHYLFLTGDQIYGDEVADPLLWALSRLGNTVLGWEEQLPMASGSPAPEQGIAPQALAPGQRSQIAETQGGFTAGLHGEPECAKSHLFSLGEYCALYLYAWSPVLWTLPLPTAQELQLQGKAAKRWQQELKEIHIAAHTVWKVRRALANVPTYMIFDDHDISDDWNLNQAWCARVLGKALGQRTVQNGMLAYALFQGWGNTPEQFEPDQVGDRLLQATVDWSTSQGTDWRAWTAIAAYLGLPTPSLNPDLPPMQVDGDTLVLDRASEPLIWHYTVQGPQHRILVLDTRTWRGYPLEDQPTAPPKLLSPTAFQRQLVQALEVAPSDDSAIAESTVDELTLIVAPTNLFSLQLIDQIQHWNLRQNQVYKNDVGDAWNIHRQALANFLWTVFAHCQQVVILSGDIHYGSAVYLEYWKQTPTAVPTASAHSVAQFAQPQILVQLTASAFKNSEAKTRMVHTKLKNLLPERIRTWIGWLEPFELQEVTPRFWTRWFKFAAPKRRRSAPPAWHYQTQWIVRQPAQTPDWGKTVEWLPQPSRRVSRRSRVQQWLCTPWRSRWFQDGREVVGRNNLGVVHFENYHHADRSLVMQDLYWYAPWHGGQIVYSRYAAPLTSTQLPAPKACSGSRVHSVDPVSSVTRPSNWDL